MPGVILLTLFIAILQLRTPCCEAVNVTEIRLVDRTTGSVANQVGLVQIQVDGEPDWGAICDDAFGDVDAAVVCRMLGFRNGGTVFLARNFPNVNTAPQYLMDDTGCAGDEETLSECISAQISDCTLSTDSIVGVSCNDNQGGGQSGSVVTTTTATPDVIVGVCAQTGSNPNPNVRLYGKDGVEGMGFVEVRNPQNSNEWGFVCDDRWSREAALVVCGELCYNTTEYTPKPGIPREHRVLPDNPTITLDNVRCVGDEQTLTDCPANPWGNEDCSEEELAGVQCLPATYQAPPPPIPVLECRDGLMIAQFSRQQDPALETKHLEVRTGTNTVCSDVVKYNDTNFVVIQIPVDRCNTRNTQSNTSHIVYENTVTYLYTTQDGSITRRNTYQVQITCALPTAVGVTQRVQPLTETVTQKASGNFVTAMEVYRNDSFEVAVVDFPVRIPLGEWLNMAVRMEESDSNLKIVLTDCVTTPTGDPSQAPVRTLIENKCPIEQTISIYPLNNFRMGFRFKPFKFVGHDLLYVHCNALVCRVEDNTRLCDRSCNSAKPETSAGRRRRKRALFNKVNHLVTSPIIILYDPHAPHSSGGTGSSSTNGGSVNMTIIADPNNKDTSSSSSLTSTTVSSTSSHSSTASSTTSTSTSSPPEAAEVTSSLPLTQQQQPLDPPAPAPVEQDNALEIVPDTDTGLDLDDGSEIGSNSRPTPPSSLTRTRNTGSSSSRDTISWSRVLTLASLVTAAAVLGSRR